MLMLQRAAENVNPSECNDPAVLLACSLGSDSCPAACQKKADDENNQESSINPYEGVVAGDLNIAVSTSNSTVSIPNDGVIKVAELNIKASENIQLQSLDVTRLGLSENSGIKVWIEKDWRRITSSSSFFGDSKANVTFNNGGYVVNGDEVLDLVISLDWTKVKAGSEIAFKLSNVVSSAKSSSVSPDTTGTYRTTQYTVTSLSTIGVNTWAVRSYNVSKDSSFSFWEFKLQNNSTASMEKDVLIRTITFKADGSIENLNNWKLLRDGKEVSSKVSIDGKTISFTVNDQLDSGKSATYKVTAEPTNIEKEGGDEYKLRIDKAQDIVAEEVGQNATAYRVGLKGERSTQDFSTIYMWTTKIAGGNITLARDEKFSSVVTADWGYSDATIAKGTIKVNQAIKFEDGAVLTVKTLSLTTASGNKLSDVIRKATLIINGKSYQASSIGTNNIVFEQEIYIDKGTHDVELQVSLQNVKPSGTLVNTPSFELNAISNTTFKTGKYVNSDETPFTTAQMAGTIRVSKVNIQAQKMSYKKNGPSADIEFVAGNTDERVVLEGQITNNSDKTLELNKFTLSGNNVSLNGEYACSTGTNITSQSACEALTWWTWARTSLTTSKKLWDFSVRFTEDGTTSSTIVLNSIGDNSVDSVTRTLEPGASIKFEVRMIPNADLVEGDAFRVAVTAEGKVDGNTTTTSPIYSANVKVKGSATAAIVASTSWKNLIVIPGASTEVASFNYNVKNDSVDLTDVVFSGLNLSGADIDDVVIDFDGNKPSITYVASDTALTLTFDNTLTLPVKNYKVKLFVTFNNHAVEKYNTAGTAQPVVISGVTLNATVNGATKSASWLGYSHYVAKAYPILSVKDKNTNSGSERLDVNVRKNKDDYTVELREVVSNLSGADWTVVAGSESSLTNNTGNIALDANTAVVIRDSHAKASINGIVFAVTDDDAHTIVYWAAGVGVKSTTMADFASLTL